MRKISDRLRSLISGSSGADPSASFARQLDEVKVLAAQPLVQRMKKTGLLGSIRDAEFKVFSLFGEDGIIQYLINFIGIEHKTFIEFGVQNYTEANTRFLLVNDNWSGLILDGNDNTIEEIKKSHLYWRYDLNAVAAFITKDNINGLCADHGFAGPVGILSIDIDGNDYWVWEAMNAVDPVVVIVEYNSLFGASAAVTIPYDPAFSRLRAHCSGQYWGCSLRALCILAERKGYCFVGTNSNGNNAFFVRKDRIGPLKPLSAGEGYAASKFRDSRDEQGRLTFVRGDGRVALIKDCEVFDIERNAIVAVRDIIAGGGHGH